MSGGGGVTEAKTNTFMLLFQRGNNITNSFATSFLCWGRIFLGRIPWGRGGFLAATCCDLVVVTHIIMIMPIAMEVIAKDDIGAFAAPPAEGAVAGRTLHEEASSSLFEGLLHGSLYIYSH
jgi:hypothetical protein